MAVKLSKPVLSNMWWELNCGELNEKQVKTLALWLNSTPAILLYFGRRVITEGAWMQMKQPAWETMPVLDVRKLEEKTLNKLAKAYDKISQRELKAIAQLDNDPARKAIDDAFCAALGLPDLAPLRELLAREPGLSGKKIG
jgi:hypothetical protein